MQIDKNGIQIIGAKPAAPEPYEVTITVKIICSTLSKQDAEAFARQTINFNGDALFHGAVSELKAEARRIRK